MAKGKKVEHIARSETKLSGPKVAELMLGPTGNLRAPTLRVKKTLYVGFPKEGFEALT